jgi:hypothetical protein
MILLSAIHINSNAHTGHGGTWYSRGRGRRIASLRLVLAKQRDPISKKRRKKKKKKDTLTLSSIFTFIE